MQRKEKKIENLKKKILLKLFLQKKKRTSRGKKISFSTVKRTKGIVKLQRNIKTKNKLFLKVNKMLCITTSKVSNRLRGLFFNRLAKNRRILFKQKPYNYKEKKKRTKIKKWVFRFNKKTAQSKKTRRKQLPQKEQILSKVVKKHNIKKALKKKKILLFSFRKTVFTRRSGKQLMKNLVQRKLSKGNPAEQTISSFLKKLKPSSSSLKRKRIKKIFKNPRVKKKLNLKWNRNRKKPVHRGFKPFYDAFGLRINYKH